MDRELLGVLVMLNNYSHDLAVAVFFVSVLAGWWLWRGLGASARDVLGRLMALARWSFGWILIAGVVRTITYYEYEWMTAAGNSQVPALIAKHVVLVAVAAGGIYGYLRLRSKTRLWRAAPGSGQGGIR